MPEIINWCILAFRHTGVIKAIKDTFSGTLEKHTVLHERNY